MSTEQREAGYYWCRSGEDWEIAYWDYDNWDCRGAMRKYYSDGIFDEIDPTPIRRPEYWKPEAGDAVFDGSKLREFWEYLTHNKPEASMGQIFRFLLEQTK